MSHNSTINSQELLESFVTKVYYMQSTQGRDIIRYITSADDKMGMFCQSKKTISRKTGHSEKVVQHVINKCKGLILGVEERFDDNGRQKSNIITIKKEFKQAWFNMMLSGKLRLNRTKGMRYANRIAAIEQNVKSRPPPPIKSRPPLNPIPLSPIKSTPQTPLKTFEPQKGVQFSLEKVKGLKKESIELYSCYPQYAVIGALEACGRFKGKMRNIDAFLGAEIAKRCGQRPRN